MKFGLPSQAITFVLSVAGFALPVLAQDAGKITKEEADQVYPSRPAYSPYIGHNYPTRPLFGDTHLHTTYSLDTGANRGNKNGI